MRPTGGSAGQKGVEFIIQRLGTPTFPRLRVGIGRPPGSDAAAALRAARLLTLRQRKYLPGILDAAADAALYFVTQGLESAMNRYNGLSRA